MPTTPPPGTSAKPHLTLIDATPQRRPTRPRRRYAAPSHLRLVRDTPATAQRATPSAVQAFTSAARSQRSSTARFAQAAQRVAGHAEALAETLRALRFAGSGI